MTATPALIAPVATLIHKTMLVLSTSGPRNPSGQRVCSRAASHSFSMPYSSRNCDNDIPGLIHAYQPSPKGLSRSYLAHQLGFCPGYSGGHWGGHCFGHCSEHCGGHCGGRKCKSQQGDGPVLVIRYALIHCKGLFIPWGGGWPLCDSFSIGSPMGLQGCLP